MAAGRHRGAGWLLIGLGTLVFAGCGDDATSEGTSSLPEGRREEAIAEAEARLELDLSTEEVRGLIEAMCAVAAGGSDDELLTRARALPAPTSPDLATALGALAAGATKRCPAFADGLDSVVESTYEAVGHEFDAVADDSTVVTRTDELDGELDG